MLLNYNNELIEIEIIRSKRTTLCLAVKEDGSVLVKVPNFLDDDKIRELVEKKADWILAKRKEMSKRESRKIKREYVTGATLPYMGKECPIEVIPFGKPSVKMEDGTILIQGLGMDEEAMQKLLKKWYKKQAKEYISKRVEFYASLMKESYGNIDIKSRKKQWGTCDSRGDLTFSWRLIMATEEAIDYVVVHELCHRKHMDHSKQFWKAVERVLPDYKQREAWLDENSVNLSL